MFHQQMPWKDSCACQVSLSHQGLTQNGEGRAVKLPNRPSSLMFKPPSYSSKTTMNGNSYHFSLNSITWDPSL